MKPTRQALLSLARSFHAKKRLGQNFLIDPNVHSNIVNYLNAGKGDKVVEIGPGLGFLTRFLADAEASVTAIELDQEGVQALRELNLNDVQIVHEDFLNFDLGTISGTFKVVGNVPYQITTPIVSRLFGEIGRPALWLPRIEDIVLTVQQEVGQRFVAQPGSVDYSRITLLVNYFAEAAILERVPPEAFYPPPKVNSAVVRLTPRQNPSVKCSDHKLLRQIIRAGFSQRRKMLKNNLSFLKLDQTSISKSLQKLCLDPQIRAEKLSLEQFAQLTDELSDLKTG